MTVDVERTTTADPDIDLTLAVDWSPAFELLLSFNGYVNRRLHPILELGQPWVKHVRQLLPAEFSAQLTDKASGAMHKDDDLLMLLVRACPTESRGDARAFLDWFANLSAGAAYEALAPRLPEDGTQLPRDFAAWRDRVVDLLGVWEAVYFRTLDPTILTGLRDEAAALRSRLGSASPLELIEQVTNGLCVEPSPEVHLVTLIPQFHERPYNHDALERGNVLIFYPADVLPPTSERPPPGLLRLTHALSDESRLRILRFLSAGQRSLAEVARFAGLSQPTVHHHMAQLRAAGLVRIHFTPPNANRYSLRSHALEQLAQQLGTYLEPEDKPEELTDELGL